MRNKKTTEKKTYKLETPESWTVLFKLLSFNCLNAQLQEELDNETGL